MQSHAGRYGPRVITLNSGINIAFLNYLYAGQYTQKQLEDNLMLGERTVRRQLEKIRLLDMMCLKYWINDDRTRTYYIEMRGKQ